MNSNSFTSWRHDCACNDASERLEGQQRALAVLQTSLELCTQHATSLWLFPTDIQGITRAVIRKEQLAVRAVPPCGERSLLPTKHCMCACTLFVRLLACLVVGLLVHGNVRMHGTPSARGNYYDLARSV